MHEELQKMLKSLRLWGLLAHWDELLAEAQRGRFSHERLLQHVLQAEYRLHSEKVRLHRRKRAHIPELLEIETFPFDRQPKLDRQRVMTLYNSFDYMTKQRNIVWMGRTGCGKTGLATGFLLQALDRGYRGYFIPFPELVAELYRAVGQAKVSQTSKNGNVTFHKPRTATPALSDRKALGLSYGASPGSTLRQRFVKHEL